MQSEPIFLGRDDVFEIAVSLLSAAGVSAPAVQSVARHVADNDLMGVSSHGLIRVPKYVDQLMDGYIDPKAEITLLSDGPAVTRLDGGRGFGIVALEEALRRTQDKAQRYGIAAALVANCAHTGRVGAFAEEAARNGFFALIFGGGAHRRYKEVAPFGGRKGVFDTNPYSFALPAGTAGPVVADFATSATAQGKMLVHLTGGTPVPEGWIIDADGNPTRDAAAFYAGGAMLPSAGQKGYGMAMIAELIGDALMGPPHELNWMMIVFDLASVRPLAEFEAAAERFAALVKACPPAEGFEEVMMPGEPERRTRERRSRTGIPVPEGTRRLVDVAARKVGLAPPFGP